MISFLKNLFFLILIPLIASCGGRMRNAPEPQSDSIFPMEISDMTDDALIYADSVISTMTLEEKAAQLFMPAILATADTMAFTHLREYAGMGVGGILLLKGDTSAASEISDSLRNISKIPPFISIDAEWGLAMRLADAPGFPVNSGLGEKVGENLMYDYGREMARESRKLGINVILGPVMDIASEGFISKRSFGDDPERVTELALAYSRGLVSGNVISVAKHFPGHGSATGDSHKEKPLIEKSLNCLDSVDLRPFRLYIDEGLPAIMVGHLAFPAIDPEMLPAAVSKTVITDLLRTDMGFRGLVFTDALNMGGAEGYGADKAIAAGADIILAPQDTRKGMVEVVEAVKENRLDIDDLNNHVRRILFYKYLFSPNPQEPEVDTVLETEETRRIQRELLK